MRVPAGAMSTTTSAASRRRRGHRREIEGRIRGRAGRSCRSRSAATHGPSAAAMRGSRVGPPADGRQAGEPSGRPGRLGGGQPPVPVLPGSYRTGAGASPAVAGIQPLTAPLDRPGQLVLVNSGISSSGLPGALAPWRPNSSAGVRRQGGRPRRMRGEACREFSHRRWEVLTIRSGQSWGGPGGQPYSESRPRQGRLFESA